MYDVLIVDDEPVARSSLKYLIDWNALGFEIKAEAANGQQALDLVKSHYFSLVLTDVRMPTMNGLEFIAKLREFSDVAVVILSGYEDFEYARKGLKMGVQDYLLKPVDDEDLVEVLRNMELEIARKYIVNKRLQLGLTALRDQFLKRWAHGQVKLQEVNEQLKLLNMQANYDGFLCMLIEMDFYQNAQLIWTDREIELKRFAIRNIIEEVCMDIGYVFEESEEIYGLVLIGTNDGLQEETCQLLAERIAQSIQMYAKDTVSIGIGQIVVDVQQVYQSFILAEQCLDGKFLMGNNTILHSKAMPQEVGQDVIRIIEDEVLLAIKSFHRDQLTKTLSRLWAGFRAGQVREDKVKLIVLEVLVILFRTIKESGANHSQIFDYQFGDYEYVMKSRTMDELYRFTEEKCFNVLDMMHRIKDVIPNHMIQTIKQLINEQYHTNISLRNVAQQVYMNPAYLGQLFRTEMDISFNDYLLKIRMEKAKELLVHSDKKVYEIAQEIGYRQLDWFYKKFKQYTGISASEYRSSI